MATFTYRALSSQGKRTRGTITAASGRHARDQLREQGLRVEEVSERKDASTIAKELGRSKRPSRGNLRYRGQLTTVIRELATLLQAGVPLLDSLDSVLSQAKKGFRDALLAVRDRVASGEGLADAMQCEPSVFDEMTVGMIRVGEFAGNLDEVCEQVADFRERSGELKDRVLSALLYPVIILAVSVAVTLFLMTVVVPMLLQNLIEIGRPLPLPTLVLKWLSDLLLNYGFWIVLAVSVVLSTTYLWAISVGGRRRIERLTLRLPVVGPLMQKQVLSRMSLVVSSLLSSGVELVDALEIAERSSTNSLLSDALSQMQQDLRSGRDLRDSVDEHPIFTHSISQVFSLGQQSGQLDKMLLRLGKDYDRQAGLMANRLTTVIEPVLILFLSIIVGFILFATILPILEAGNVLAE